MTWEAMHEFPGWVALIAAIAAILAAWCALVWSVLDLVIRRLAR